MEPTRAVNVDSFSMNQPSFLPSSLKEGERMRQERVKLEE